MIKVNVYLNFDGKTEEAFNFYKSVFGGEFKSLQRFKDMPESERPMPEKEGEKVMHVALPIGDDVLMGSDVPESMSAQFKEGNNVYLSLHPDSKEEMDRLFRELSKGGKVEMAPQKMFWGDYFTSFSDKFGVQWMINYEEKKK